MPQPAERAAHPAAERAAHRLGGILDHQQPFSLLKLGQARGMALLAPAMGGLVVAEYPPNLVKKSVVGVGHAEKHQVGAMIALLSAACAVQKRG